MPLSSQPDPILTITGPGGTIVFQYFEIPEFIHFGGPARVQIHKQPGGARQIDSLGPDPGPISWNGIMLTADGWARAQALYVIYEAGDMVTVVWRGWERQAIISDLKIKYKAVNYVEYFIELTEVTVAGAENAVGTTVGDIGNALNAAVNVGNQVNGFAATVGV